VPQNLYLMITVRWKSLVEKNEEVLGGQKEKFWAKKQNNL
jgi:hypothetical protein